MKFGERGEPLERPCFMTICWIYMRIVWIDEKAVALIQLRTSLYLEYLGLGDPLASLDGGVCLQTVTSSTNEEVRDVKLNGKGRGSRQMLILSSLFWTRGYPVNGLGPINETYIPLI